MDNTIFFAFMFEKRMLHHLEEIDGIVLSCREKMMEEAGEDSLEL